MSKEMMIIPIHFLPSDMSQTLKEAITYILLTSLLIITSYLIMKNIEKVKRILNEPSYCLLSVYINYLSIATLAVHEVLLVYSMVLMVVLGPSYESSVNYNV